jgi:hypothetical protein
LLFPKENLGMAPHLPITRLCAPCVLYVDHPSS